MTTVLLTGFEPFGGAARNSSWDAVELVSAGWTGPAELVTARLPVEFGRTGDELLALVEESLSAGSYVPDAAELAVEHSATGLRLAVDTALNAEV